MKQHFQNILLVIFLFFSNAILGQDISLIQQFNGRYDFVFFGNTLNPEENSFQFFPYIFTSSSATLNLNPNDEIEKAYLYWAGCGTGDFDVKLNGETINPDRTFNHQRSSFNLTYNYFSAFKDVTSQIQTTGNGIYTLSDFDVSPFINLHFTNRTNFAGWAIIVIYKNPNLPLNQLNIYDGLQAVPDEINITLNNLNVIDNQDAKIGFLAWEGDVGIAVNEQLTINGNPISNPPLNPVDNAFNGTNSFTNSNTLYNMDLDSYPIQNNIKIGDTSAQIRLTSGQDFVMINAIVTKFNIQLPDATITINDVKSECDSKIITVDYTVSNLNSTSSLPSNTSVSIYINKILYQTIYTQSNIPINGNETSQIIITIPPITTNTFDLKFMVDDIGNGTGIVPENFENNNEYELTISLPTSPLFNTLTNKEACNEGLTKGTFDFSDFESLVKVNSTDVVRFYETLKDAENNTNAIINTTQYQAQSTPKTIYIRLENDFCYSTTSFLLTTYNCPPTIYNFVSANSDGANDSFHIKGLKDVFENYKIEIYNRWGTLVWTGNKTTKEWDGFANQGVLIDNKRIPSGTYYYIIYLNDPDYTQPLVGYLFLTQ
ncbi:gliding motility-associated C-terminal domain-containing protein [Flavobacterium sp. NG2]|uniref:gliding motility-associated C-terminal domain-containing protein n=1 Tax=Flavobacterium sp. NG2 TaxID=3097547 RepID=UPI002A800A9B|nr:gliding motility-associated C-terminal domain-containing protein [Flavobacterium sp. NG2]WPR70193.1 gliding motility-associated C-terminal domain-containing protein [Flavobacterium sp. NG2]